MRTKTLLLTAALSAAGVATSMAQVYSVNAVGYYNLTITNGVELIANQLNTGGNKYSETIILPNDPAYIGTTIYYLESGGIQSSTYLGAGLWVPDNVLAPGDAVYLVGPGSTPATFTITLVGEVPQGQPLTTPVAATVDFVSSQVPQAGAILADLKIPGGVIGDTILFYNSLKAGGAGYESCTFLDATTLIPDINIPVGHGVVALYTTAKSWTRNFSVNP